MEDTLLEEYDNEHSYSYSDLIDKLSYLIGSTSSDELCDTLTSVYDYMEAQRSEIVELKERLSLLEEPLNNILREL